MTANVAIDAPEHVSVVYLPVDNAGAEPDLSSWVEIEFEGASWSADWVDAQVRASTHRVGVDAPQHIMKKERTEVSWGAEASFVQFTILVATSLYEWVATEGVEQLGRAVAERRPSRDETPTLDAVGTARQRVALRHDTDAKGLVTLGSTARDGAVVVTLREPESTVTYEVTVTTYAPGTYSVRCTRRQR